MTTQGERDLIRKRLRDEGDKLIKTFESLSPAQRSMTLYSDGMTWTLQDLVAHLGSAERAFLYYGRDILGGGEGAPEGFDINAFNNGEVGSLRVRTYEQLLDDLRAVRQETIDMVGRIADEDFARTGRHPFFGQMAIEEMFKLIYRHNMMHLRDVRRAMGESRMSERKEAIRRHLEATRARLVDAVAGLSEAQWEHPVASSEGAWTVKQVVAHLASAEPGQTATGQRMLAGEARLPESFSLDFWNQRQVEKRKDRAPADLLSDLSQSRQRLTAWIDGLSEADLDKSGQHARGDFITVAQLCFRIGEHEAQHADEIRRALGK